MLFFFQPMLCNLTKWWCWMFCFKKKCFTNSHLHSYTQTTDSQNKVISFIHSWLHHTSLACLTFPKFPLTSRGLNIVSFIQRPSDINFDRWCLLESINWCAAQSDLYLLTSETFSHIGSYLVDSQSSKWYLAANFEICCAPIWTKWSSTLHKFPFLYLEWNKLLIKV